MNHQGIGRFCMMSAGAFLLALRGILLTQLSGFQLSTCGGIVNRGKLLDRVG